MASALPRPALLGGPPVRPQGPPAWPPPDDDILRALQGVYHDSSWGKYHGGNVERLEQQLARYHNVAFAVTCASGTFAVELALRSLKVGPGDEVILAAYDYPGNFLSVHAVGAQPVLVDVAANNWNLDPGCLAAAVGPKTKAVIASHLHGGVVAMRRVMEIATAHGLRVVEDAAQMPGAVVEGRRAGTWGDAGVLSFGGSKLLTAGRGGALLTRHGDVAQRAQRFIRRGNLVCPLSELQAAVLLPQLGKLDERNALRAGNAALLARMLQGLPDLEPFANDLSETQPGYYKLGLQFDPEGAGLSRERLAEAARAEGVALDEGFRALHLGRSPSRFRQAGTLPQAERAHHGTLVLHHPVLLGGESNLAEVVLALRKVLAHNTELDQP